MAASFLVAALTLVTLQVVLLTITLFSELLCLCLLFATILSAERSVELDLRERDAAAWALARVAGGTRVSDTQRRFADSWCSSAVLLDEKETAPCAVVSSPALPLAAGWHVWTFLHAGPGNDATNASYIGEYLRIIRVNGLWSNFLKQFASFSGAVAENAAPGFIEFVAGLPLYHLALAAAISGGIRIGRSRSWPLYLIFSALYCFMVLLWWFEGMTRLIIPAWPMLLAGMSEEAAHLATLFEKSMARSAFWSQKFSLWRSLPRWGLVALGLATVFRNDLIAQNRIAIVMRDERQLRMEDEVAFAWISAEPKLRIPSCWHGKTDHFAVHRRGRFTQPVHRCHAANAAIQGRLRFLLRSSARIHARTSPGAAIGSRRPLQPQRFPGCGRIFSRFETRIQFAVRAHLQLPHSTMKLAPTHLVAPVAKKVPHATTIHGDTRIDNYFWLRDREAIPYVRIWKPKTATPRR